MEIIALLYLVALIIWGLGLIDILRNEFIGANKIIWLALVFFIPVLGTILYIIIGRKQKI